MLSHNRNIKVVGWLVCTLSVGATLLLWLEPPAQVWAPAEAMARELHAPIEAVEIDCTPLQRCDADAYDGMVFPDGRFAFRQRGSQVRVAIVAEPDADLPANQAKAVLAVIGSLRTFGGLDLKRVRLASDDAGPGNLPTSRPAQQLAELLQRKGLLQ